MKQGRPNVCSASRGHIMWFTHSHMCVNMCIIVNEYAITSNDSDDSRRSRLCRQKSRCRGNRRNSAGYLTNDVNCDLEQPGLSPSCAFTQTFAFSAPTPEFLFPIFHVASAFSLFL